MPLTSKRRQVRHVGLPSPKRQSTCRRRCWGALGLGTCRRPDGRPACRRGHQPAWRTNASNATARLLRPQRRSTLVPTHSNRHRVLSFSMAGERSARSASARSRAATSSRKSTWRRQAETESRSSSGCFIPSSQRRPRRPKRSLGRRGQRLRARADLVLRAACGRAAAAPGGRRAGPAPLSPRPGSTPPRGNPRRAAWPGCGRRVYRSWPWRGDQLEPAGVGTTTQATSGSIIRAIYVAPIVGLERLVLRTQARRAQLKRLRSRLDRPRRALPRRPRRSHLAVVAVDVYPQ